MLRNIDLEEAQQITVGKASPLGSEEIPIMESLGQVLSRDLTAGQDLPPMAQSAVDGFALGDGVGEINSRYAVKANLGLGEIASIPLGYAEAVGVLTGGVIPAGTVAVVPREKAINDSDAIKILEVAKAGNNIKPAGEDFHQGDLLAAKGCRLTPGVIALLAAYGMSRVPVYKQPRIAILGLGANVVPCYASPEPGQTRDCNGPLLSALIKGEGGKITAAELAVKSTPEALRDQAIGLLEQADLLLTTGGTYLGGEAEVLRLMNTMGAQLLYWEVPIQPGSHHGACLYNEHLLLALSGNPAACAVGYHLFVAPVLKAMQGRSPVPQRVNARCLNPFPKKSGSRRFVRAQASVSASGWEVYVLPGQKPSMIRSLLNCNALIDLPAGNPPIEAGDEVSAILLEPGF